MCCTGFGQNAFNNYYQSGSLSFANKISYVNNNEFILSSYYMDSITGQQGLDLKRLDNQGQVQFRKRYLFRNDDYYSFLNNNVQADISNSTMLLTAGTYSNGDRAVIFTSVNKSTLDTNWAKYYSDGIYAYYLNNVFKTRPNEVWFMGHKGNNNGYASRPTVIKTDTLGNLLSIKEFSNLVGYVPNTIYFDQASSLLFIAGRTVSTPTAQQGFIVCADTMGNIIWDQQMDSSPSILHVSQITRRNNYLVLSGFKWAAFSGGNNHYKLCLTKLNIANGSLIWQKTYGWQGIFNNLRGCVVTNDESIVAVGAMQFPIAIGVVNPNGIILKANSNGDSLWLRSYSTYTANLEEQFYDVQACPDGGYIACGVPSLQQNYHSWVVKTDSLGYAPGIYTNTVYTPPPSTMVVPGGEGTITSIYDDENENTGYKIFPNPVDELLTIEFGAEPQPYKTFQLYNCLGQLVREEELPLTNKTININTSGLKPGFYFIRLSNGSNKNTSHKIIISH